ncbi:MAG: AraC family transcriptional regulator [Spirochaetales bacterium]|nr:AraC family transcriptional regulator [Spirochaetales bacterium]
MNNRDIIYQSLNIIEEQLHCALNVQNLAEKIGYSVHYFTHLFKGITGHSPGAYLQKRRITKAWEKLREGKHSVTEVALDMGFQSPESFSRAFRNQLGISPRTAFNPLEPKPTNLLMPLTGEKIEAYRRMAENHSPELITKGPLNLIGLPLYGHPDQLKDFSKPWETLFSHKDSIPSRVVPERYYQVQYWLPDQESDELFFLFALEGLNLQNVPLQFTTKQLPEQLYLRFFHHGPSHKVGKTYEYIYQSYLPETDYKLSAFFNFEYYPPHFTSPHDEYAVSEIYIPVQLP